MAIHPTESIIPRKRALSVEKTTADETPSQDSKTPRLESGSSSESGDSLDIKKPVPEMPSALIQQNMSLIIEIKGLLKTNQDDALAFEGKLLERINRGDYKNIIELMKDNYDLIKKIRGLLLVPNEDALCRMMAFDTFLVQAVEGEKHGAGVVCETNDLDPDESFFDPGEEEACAESLNRLRVGDVYHTPLSPPLSPSL